VVATENRGNEEKQFGTVCTKKKKKKKKPTREEKGARFRVKPRHRLGAQKFGGGPGGKGCLSVIKKKMWEGKSGGEEAPK